MRLQAQDTAPESLLRNILETFDSVTTVTSSDDEQFIKDTAGMMYIGAVDTTVSCVISFVLAMILHPEVQAKGQAEIDRVIGNDRLPEMSDRDQLPYVSAIVDECYRWIPVAPLGMVHCVI
jgi:cytochrome P450